MSLQRWSTRLLRQVRGLNPFDGDCMPTPLSEKIRAGTTTKEGLSSAQSALYDRHVRAFCSEGQERIIETKVGIVGTGGTGSAVAEHVVRLGVSDVLLIDPDYHEPTNRTRVYGSFHSFDGRRVLKVDLVSEHLRKINSEVMITTINENVVTQEATRLLRDRDVIFLCTDDHWGRSVVNQMSYQYIIPVINMGTTISALNVRMAFALGVVDVLRPGNPCLWCSQFLRADRIAAESMPAEMRHSLRDEGYVEGVDEPAPSVISLNTTVAGLAVIQFLQLVTGFMGDAGDVARLNYDAVRSTVRRGRAPALEGCVCTRTRGFGDLRTLPVMADLGGS